MRTGPLIYVVDALRWPSVDIGTADHILRPRRSGAVAGAGYPLANDLRQAQAAPPDLVATGVDQVQRRHLLGTLFQRQRLEQSLLQFAPDRVLGKPGESQHGEGGMDRGGLVAEGPALLGFEPARVAAASGTGIANDQLAVPSQIFPAQRPRQLMQRMIRVRGR